MDANTNEKLRIGFRIKELRMKKRLTQVELDKLLYSANVTCGWETGRSLPRADTIVDLCKALGCSPNDLFEWEKRK